MKVVTPISTFSSELDKKIPEEKQVTIFLAGGISNCPDWQSSMIESFGESTTSPYLILYNPRRAHINLKDIDVARQQIRWEHEQLVKSEVILFWFPKESICPITLFELGRWTGELNKTVFVGVDPDYSRKVDIEEQMKLVRPKMKIAESLSDLYEQVINTVNTMIQIKLLQFFL